MRLNHVDYALRKTGPYTAEEAVAMETENAEGGTVERLQSKIDCLQGILGRLIDAMPARSKADREELARVIGHNWEPEE
jgi:hypothetical protein